MRNTLTILFLFAISVLRGQFCSQVITLDQIEYQDWTGYWLNGVGTTKTNYFTSYDKSAVLEGVGTGTSATERDVYVLPNYGGLIPTNNYKILLHIGAYTLGGTLCPTCPAGNDVEDSIQICYSSDGGVTYTKEISITGRSNAYWNYNNFGIIKPASGTNFVRAPIAGGNRTFTGDGYSSIELQLPSGITQVAAKLYCNVNALGESWWIDDIMLVEIAPCPDLPVSLMFFTAKYDGEKTILHWQTASELNNDYWTIKRSPDAVSWTTIDQVYGMGTSDCVNGYMFFDRQPLDGINYYTLTQTDYDGKSETFKMVYVVVNKPEYPTYDVLGNTINLDDAPSGLYFKNGKKILKQ